MQRGILHLTKRTLHLLLHSLDLSKYEGMPLATKLISANKVESDDIKIELSEDELESLYDEIALPKDGESLEMRDVRQSLLTLMQSFRSQG